MQYDLGHVVLDLDQILIDETTYVFENKHRGWSLLISFDPPPPGLSPEDILRELTEQLRMGFSGQCTPATYQPTTLLGEPAAQVFVQLGLAHGGGEVHLLAATGPRRITLLKLLTAQPTEAGSGRATFEHMVRSVAPSPMPGSHTGAPGYIRRQAGPVTLDVPEMLGIPQSFTFTTTDRAVYLTLQYRSGSVTPGPPLFEELLTSPSPQARLELVSEEERPLAVAGMKGQEGRWELRHLRGGVELERHIVRSLSLQVRDGLVFQARGVARGVGRAILDSTWAQMTMTLRRGDGT